MNTCENIKHIVKISIWSNSEYSNTIIWSSVKHQTVVKRLKDRVLKITLQ